MLLLISFMVLCFGCENMQESRRTNMNENGKDRTHAQKIRRTLMPKCSLTTI